VSGTRPRGVRASGTVHAFDDRAGLGVLRLEDGREVGFHATQLADGTRTTEVGHRVEATIVPWHRGRDEATEIHDMTDGVPG